MTRAPSGSARIEEMLGPAGAVYGAVKPLVGFLADPMDETTGDPEGLRSSAAAWRAAAADMRELSGQELTARHTVMAAWEGDAAQAFDAEMSAVYDNLVEIAQHFDDTADLLEQGAVGAQEAQEVVEQIVRELIAWAIVTLIIALGSSWITLGASMVAGAGLVAAEAAVAAGRCLVVTRRLVVLLRSLRDFLKAMSTFAKTYKLTKIRSLGARNWATARYASKGGYQLLGTNWVIKKGLVEPTLGGPIDDVTGAGNTWNMPPIL